MSTKIRKTSLRLVMVTLAMFGFGFALVPLYDVFCDVTGLNGRTENGPIANAQAYTVDSSRLITVEFIASVNQSLPWEFRPEVVKMQVHPGQVYRTQFYAENRASQAIVGHAVPSVAPGLAAQHFHKTECFCFTEQRFEAGEGRWMPVQFIIDPELPTKYEIVTLSYTFFDSGKMTTQKPGLETL